jgi:hypothetical protein
MADPYEGLVRGEGVSEKALKEATCALNHFRAKYDLGTADWQISIFPGKLIVRRPIEVRGASYEIDTDSNVKEQVLLKLEATRSLPPHPE